MTGFGSLPLTHVVIEEAGEIVHKARAVITSRKDRKLNRQYGITGKAVLTCNPSPNFVREEFYEPYVALGGGDLRTWEFANDQGEPIHAEVGGTTVRARRAFVRSLPTDNPFLSGNYIQNLKSLPAAERRRLLKGEWDFDDDETTLFKLHLIQTTPAVDPDAEKYAGCDPSRGGDACVFTALQGNVVTDQQQLTIPATVEDKGTFVAQAYIAFCQSHGIGYDNASLDVVGIGASVYDSCIRLGFKVRAFNAGSTKGVRQLDRHGRVVDGKDGGTPLFDNIRSQGYYDMSEATHTGGLQLLDSLPHADELRRELGADHREVRERMTIVEKKDKIKAAIGHSPDFADSLLAAWGCRAYRAKSLFRVRRA